MRLPSRKATSRTTSVTRSRSLLPLRRRALHGGVEGAENAVERVAHRPRFRLGVGRPVRVRHPAEERLAHAGATLQRPDDLQRRLLVEVEAGLRVALVVDRRPDLDRLLDLADRELDLVDAA